MFTNGTCYSLIDGALERGGSELDVINPATGVAAAKAMVPPVASLDRAVRAAVRAFDQWRAESWTIRTALLLALADAVRVNTAELARLLTIETGKPIGEARDEISQAADLLTYYADIEIKPNVLARSSSTFVEQSFVPLGVVAGIIPWNFPLFTTATKIAPALLAGNSILVKAAPTAPLALLRFGELVKDLVPAGLLQIIADDGTLGPRLVRHRGIAKISFTGSTANGKAVMKAAADRLSRVALELGGNDPAIVFDDADIDHTAAAIFRVAFLNCGQVCTAIKRLYVQDNAYDRIVELLAARARALTMGDGLDEAITIGPVQNASQFAKLKAYMEEARTSGTIVAGGGVRAGGGYFVEPTIVVGLPDKAKLVREEQFGPILPVLRFTDENEVIRRANDTRYGLTASVWTGDLERAHRVARRLDVGTVWINKHLELNPRYPMSPCKESGIGSEFGLDGLREFTQARLLNQ